MKVLGLITARGGSKSIPGKNIKDLAGKPLIAWTIEAAKESGVLDRVILSTDDKEIARVARECGCEVPFMRPHDLSGDETPHVPVIQHALSWLKENEEYVPDYVMLLQPTSPTRRPFHIQGAVACAKKFPDADSVLSITKIPVSYNSGKSMMLDGGKLRLCNGDPIYKRTARRQDLSDEYCSAGFIFLAKTELLTGADPNLYGEHTLPYEIESKYLVDIDEPEDWLIAEAKMRAILEGTL